MLASGKRNSTIKSLQAPVGGWNAKDSIANMKESYAIILKNYWPSTSEVGLRLGYSEHATGLPDKVETLAAYNAGTTKKLFAASGNGIYEVTSSGAVGSASVTSLTNARFQHVNFATAGGKFLYLVNGADKPILYNGSTFTQIDGVSTPAITGVTTTNLISVAVHQRRLWFVESNSMKIWYLAVDSIGGAATSIDFSSLFKRGGYLMAMGSWTIDTGSGMDDHAVFISSEGEIAVYKGYDPATADTWQLVGVYSIGSPIGRRCVMKYASDLVIICRDGLVPMSRVMSGGRADAQFSLTDKIQKAMVESVNAYSANFGWQLIVYPAANLLIMNVPITNGQEQYCMNTITGAWARFTDWHAECWELFNDQIYFGGDEYVGLAWDGHSDNGNNIFGEALQAYSYFSTQGIKHFKMVRPILSSDGSFGITLNVNIDFKNEAPTGTPTFSPATAALWDSAIWDSAVWGGELSIKKDWQTVSGVGYCAAIHFKTASSNAIINWSSTDFVYEAGRGL